MELIKENADVIVIGGGLGGSMAALSAAQSGVKVIMSEETEWLGGQLTSQAVPPDEHKWIESFGCTATYREFRNRVRDYYKRNYPLTEAAMADPLLNPGNGWVSRLAHEPKVALRVIEDMLAVYVNSGRIRIFFNCRPVDAQANDDLIESVTVERLHDGKRVMLKGDFYIDATECGDLLPLAGVEHVTGAESKEMTGEPHAAETEAPLDMQAITHVFAVDYIEGGDFTIEQPEQYTYWEQFVPAFSHLPLLSWFSEDIHNQGRLREFTMFPNDKGIQTLFDYRRILDVSNLSSKIYEGDVTLVNWPQNDYFDAPVIGVSDTERQKNLEAAKQLSLSLLYWLQTKAPRIDGGVGYPELRLRKDILGTDDGLAKYPYIRESRRIKAVYTITEQDVSKELRGPAGIKVYKDSIGVGCYDLDLHHTTGSSRSFYIPAYPYEIPLGAILPVRVKNLLTGCKNIGTTQITNGCYRLHPTEWNIGESAGCLAAFSILHQTTPHEVYYDEEKLRAYQAMLEQRGVQLHWPEGMELS